VIDLGLEPEPLAFRVRPQPQECFDSWIDRLAAAHETNRITLFGHLGIDRGLAGIDLARGGEGLAGRWHGAFDHLVARLAWAVRIAPEQVRTTFLTCDAAALLPPRLRRFACARCWFEARSALKPAIVEREWILRASWRCREHGMPLSDMGEIALVAEGRRLLVALAHAVLKAQRLRWQIKARPVALRRNVTALDYLVNSEAWQGLGVPDRPYQARFSANSYHFGVDRIGLLALAHSSRHGAARSFERLVSARLPQRPRPGGGVRDVKKRPYRLQPGFLPKPRLRWCAPELLDLLQAYGEVRNRRDAERELEAIFARMPVSASGLVQYPAMLERPRAG
jgi:hypothetical protein